VCTGTPVHYEQTVRGLTSVQARHIDPPEDAASVHGYTATPVHYEQTVRELISVRPSHEDATEDGPGQDVRKRHLRRLHPGAYTRPLLSSTSAVPDIKYTLDTPSSAIIPAKHPLKEPLNAPPIPQKVLTLSQKVNECKPLPPPRPRRRGLHSFTLELNFSSSRTHSGLSWVTRWTEELKLS
jgi:hypothetical protein